MRIERINLCRLREAMLLYKGSQQTNNLQCMVGRVSLYNSTYTVVAKYALISWYDEFKAHVSHIDHYATFFLFTKDSMRSRMTSQWCSSSDPFSKGFNRNII